MLFPLSFQVVTELHATHIDCLSAANTSILLEIICSVASHAHLLNSETILQRKLQRVCSILELTAPPMVHFENESYQNYLNFLSNLIVHNPLLCNEINVEDQLVAACEKILRMYLDCTGYLSAQQIPVTQPVICRILPLSSAKKEELAARTSLVVLALRALSDLEKDSLRKYVSQVFPLLVDLVRSEHSSEAVQHVLSNLFQSCIGPIIMQ